MPFSLRWEAGGVVKHHYGHLTGSELVAGAVAVSSDPRYDRLRYIINDFRAVTSDDISLSDIEHYASLRIGAALSNRNVLSPFVATSEPGLSVARMLQQPTYRNDHPVEIFPDLDSAQAWLAQEGQADK
ncbi:hypothetical protein VX159_02820 [Dechloromonas sp. ZY10]|uniref:hypothetical protein n=1 Tax=Dechloromonas aquae TaxID=2664436 RepID=UPI0035274E51